MSSIKPAATDCADFLFELGTEELPPTSLNTLAVALQENLLNELRNVRLGFNEAAVKRFATPRRLALLIPDLATGQADTSIEKLGPAVAAAFDADGKPLSLIHI